MGARLDERDGDGVAPALPPWRDAVAPLALRVRVAYALGAMVIPHIALWAILNGPTCRRRDVRRVLAEHLAVVRRERRGARAPRPAEESPWDDGAPFSGDGFATEATEDPAVLAPAEVLVLVAEAAIALDRQWNEDVLDSPPSRLMFGLCGVADRGAFLLEDAAPDLAGRFRQLRDLFMRHSQGGEAMTDDELGRAVDELDALIPAVLDRAKELHARLGPE